MRLVVIIIPVNLLRHFSIVTLLSGFELATLRIVLNKPLDVDDASESRYIGTDKSKNGSKLFDL